MTRIRRDSQGSVTGTLASSSISRVTPYGPPTKREGMIAMDGSAGAGALAFIRRTTTTTAAPPKISIRITTMSSKRQVRLGWLGWRLGFSTATGVTNSPSVPIKRGCSSLITPQHVSKGNYIFYFSPIWRVRGERSSADKQSIVIRYNITENIKVSSGGETTDLLRQRCQSRGKWLADALKHRRSWRKFRQPHGRTY